VIVNNHLNDVCLVPSVPTPPVALVSSESETYLGLLIMAAFWAFFSGAVVALSEHEASQSEALSWVVSFAAATLVAAFCFGMLL
jgi:hypothetical protein